MKCPACRREMKQWTLDGRSGEVTTDVCAACQAFWFDSLESLNLTPGSTLMLMKFIGESTSQKRLPLPERLSCPRCDGLLLATHDLQRNMRFSYWRCRNEHGKFISFFDFLKEKNFIHPLTADQIKELRKNMQTVNCSNCGAPVDLERNMACPFCRSPISMLDMKQPQALLEQLKQAAAPRPADPQLPAKLIMAKLDAMRSVSAFDRDLGHDDIWWSDAGSVGLVQAGLNAIARWLVE